MEQPVTYQELLAQQYEESARDLLAFQQIDYDKELEDVGAYQQDTMDTYAVERPDEFNTFGGNRNTEEIISRTADFNDKSKFSVRYNKDVKINTFNIDSRFRAYVNPGVISKNPVADNAPTEFNKAFNPTAVSSSSHFIFRIRRQIKNAISIKLSSLELPNTFANFSNARGNTSFGIRPYNHATQKDYVYVNIDSDDIPEYIPNAQLLAATIQTQLRKLKVTYPSIFTKADTFTCDVNDQGYIVIGNTNGTATNYDFDFGYTPVEIPLFEPLGTLMGFKSTVYSNVLINQTGSAPSIIRNSLTATYLPDLNTDDYIYMNVNDYSTVVPQTINDTYFTVFAKIPVTVDKGQVIFDNDSNNSTNKTYRFLLPSNLQQFDIQLLDRAGEELTFDGNYSMTLEVEEILNQSLYEKMREL